MERRSVRGQAGEEVRPKKLRRGWKERHVPSSETINTHEPTHPYPEFTDLKSGGMESSGCFNALVWGNGSGARLNVIEPKGGAPHIHRIDAPTGGRYECEVSLNADGKLEEEGIVFIRAPEKTTIDWTIVYDKPVKKAD